MIRLRKLDRSCWPDSPLKPKLSLPSELRPNKLARLPPWPLPQPQLGPGYQQLCHSLLLLLRTAEPLPASRAPQLVTKLQHKQLFNLPSQISMGLSRRSMQSMLKGLGAQQAQHTQQAPCQETVVGQQTTSWQLGAALLQTTCQLQQEQSQQLSAGSGFPWRGWW